MSFNRRTKKQSAGEEIRMRISGVSTSCLSALNLQNTGKQHADVTKSQFSGWILTRRRRVYCIRWYCHVSTSIRFCPKNKFVGKVFPPVRYDVFFINICSSHSQNTRSGVVELRYQRQQETAAQ